MEKEKKQAEELLFKTQQQSRVIVDMSKELSSLKDDYRKLQMSSDQTGSQWRARV